MDDLRFPYRAYTKVNDRTINNAQIIDAIREYPDSRFPAPDFSAFHKTAQSLYQAPAFKLAEALRDCASGVAVSLLVDHSGSLRGETACQLASVVGAVSCCLTAAKVSNEILGFTTRSWHGGKSRAAWLKSGDAFPGRVCDLLHIVHRPFAESSALAFEELRRMTLPALCKENIDGEALEWAVGRLRAAAATRRILLVVSDGAPVDDSTLLANHPSFLTSHLQAVTAAIVAQSDVELYALSVERDHWLPHYYPQYAVASDIGEIAQIALPFVASIVASSASMPVPTQLSDRAPFKVEEATQTFELP
jgi:cobaltochelatase CobT